MEVIMTAANDMGTFASSLQERRKARQQQFGVVAAILKRKFFQGRVESSHTQRKKWHFCTKQKQCGKKIYICSHFKKIQKNKATLHGRVQWDSGARRRHFKNPLSEGGREEGRQKKRKKRSIVVFSHFLSLVHFFSAEFTVTEKKQK